MKDLYSIAGISKQAVWKDSRRKEQVMSIHEEVIGAIEQIRTNHKRMGCRTIYHTTKGSMQIGRDVFEQIGFANGFKLKKKRNAVRTTWSQRIEVFPNLIEGLILNGINQLWQSDIFYFNVENKPMYGVTIEDVYSRKLLALHFSPSLQAEQNVLALKKAFKARSGKKLEGCIFHSDRGSQYISEVHKSMLTEARMHISMAKIAQQNAYVERIQGTIKNDYLTEHSVTLANLKSMAHNIIKWYNEERPHSSLGMMTPEEFETHVESLVEKEKPTTEIYQWSSELQTKLGVIDKKKKEAKKKKSTKQTGLNQL